MKTKIISLLFIALTALSTTSCLNDDYLFDFDNMQAVIELPYVDHSQDLTYRSGATSVSTNLYVNYSIADWRNINEEIPVTVNINESLLPGGAELLPPSSYNLKFPLTMTIKKASDVDSTDRDKLNNQSATEVLTIDLTNSNLTAGKTYVLPLEIASAPSQYVISGNFRTVLFYVTIK